MLATETVYGFVESEEVPTEHDQRSGQAAAYHKDNAGLHSSCKTDLPRFGGRKVLQVEIEFFNFVVAEEGDEEIDDEEDTAHNHPIIDHAIVT